MMLVLVTSLLQGVATTAQATTEELLTELDKPSEYFSAPLFGPNVTIEFLIYFVKNSVSELRSFFLALGDMLPHFKPITVTVMKLSFQS
jgi:hypothetical protein